MILLIIKKSKNYFNKIRILSLQRDTSINISNLFYNASLSL